MKEKISFMTVSAFKKALGVTSLTVEFNSNSGKLSVLDSDGNFYRCQQDIDQDAHLAFLIPDGEVENACLVNTKTDGSPLTTKFAL